jgi:hypothetical protein
MPRRVSKFFLSFECAKIPPSLFIPYDPISTTVNLYGASTKANRTTEKNVFVIEKLGTAIWRSLKLYVFSVDDTNEIREVPQVPKVIHDLRPSCPGRGWHNFMF